jgi:S-adenosyl-L-methionine hydrolase (adenosine-forming)
VKLRCDRSNSAAFLSVYLAMKRPIITLLTDFGLTDHYVAAMKGVILAICPQATLIDISHQITPFAIPEAAYTLSQVWQTFPKGTTHLAVVDPGVGSARRAIVAEVSGHRFVAPDNGLLTMILESNSRSRVREITASRYFRHPVSATFHGRDVFAPVAAHLASEVPLARLGSIISDALKGDFSKPEQKGPNHWQGVVLKIDRFGNIITNFGWKSFLDIADRPFRLQVGRQEISDFHSTYASAPQNRLFALRGSSGYVEISLNQSDASALAGVGVGSAIQLFF